MPVLLLTNASYYFDLLENSIMIAMRLFITIGLFTLMGCSESNASSSDAITMRVDATGSQKQVSAEPSEYASSTETHDEFGGAKPGMLYPEFRRRLIAAGLKPRKPEGRDHLCRSDPDYYACEYLYDETDSCSGTGEGFCNYIWSRGKDKFIVLTRESEGGLVVEMRFDR